MSLRDGACIAIGSEVFEKSNGGHKPIKIEQVEALFNFEVSGNKKKIAGSTSVNNLKPLRSLTGYKAYPILKYTFKEKSLYPLLKIGFLISSSAYISASDITKLPTQADKAPERYVETEVSLWHPFLTDNGVVPADLLRLGDTVDGITNPATPFSRKAMVVRIEPKEPCDVVGLVVGSFEYASELSRESEELVSELNLINSHELNLPPEPEEHHGNDGARGQALNLISQNLIRSADDRLINGLRRQAHFIYSRASSGSNAAVASGTLTVQSAMVGEYKRGLSLRDLL